MNPTETKLRPRSEYHEDYGVVCWWDSGVCDSHEPPYIGTPNDIGADGICCLPNECEWWSPCPDFEPMVRANESAAITAALAAITSSIAAEIGAKITEIIVTGTSAEIGAKLAAIIAEYNAVNIAADLTAALAAKEKLPRIDTTGPDWETLDCTKGATRIDELNKGN